MPPFPCPKGLLSLEYNPALLGKQGNFPHLPSERCLSGPCSATCLGMLRGRGDVLSRALGTEAALRLH